MGASLTPSSDDEVVILTGAPPVKDPTRTRSVVSRPRLDQLQILRFVAASAVVLFHWWGGIQSALGIERNYFYLGASGVDVFFVLSGFIIAYSSRPEKGPAYFAVRRIARIVPLYWTLTLGVAAVSLLSPHLLNSTTFSWENLMKSLFFIPYQKENGLVQPMLFLGWTLNYEMFFYSVFALTLCAPKWSPILPCSIITAFVLVGQFVPFDRVVWRFYTNPITLEFVFGVLLFRVWTARSLEFATYRVPLFAISVVLFALSLKVDSYLLRPFIQGVAATSLTAAVLSLSVPHTKFWNGLILCGNASYSIYLIHPYILQAFTKSLGSVPSYLFLAAGSAIAFGLCIAVSVALYLALEVRAQSLVLNWWNGLTPAKRSRAA